METELNKELRKAHYYATKKGEITDELAEAFKKIILVLKDNFKYPLDADIQSDVLLYMLQYITICSDMQGGF